jgi:hypothetical protein
VLNKNLEDNRDLLMKIIEEIFEEGDRSHKEQGACAVEYRRGLSFCSKLIAKYRKKYWNKNILNN